jgi:hypothetical protein
MTAFGLDPGFMVVDYQSPYAFHKMRLPTRAWSPVGSHGFGSFTAWDASTIQADEMVADLFTNITKLYRPEVTFAGATIFTQASPTASPLPAAFIPFTGIVGLDGTVNWTEAVEEIITFYDTAFYTSKLVLLDVNSLNNFARRSAATLSADELSVAASWMSLSSAWSSRAGFRPSAVRSASLGINDALKKTYPGI